MTTKTRPATFAVYRVEMWNAPGSPSLSYGLASKRRALSLAHRLRRRHPPCAGRVERIEVPTDLPPRRLAVALIDGGLEFRTRKLLGWRGSAVVFRSPEVQRGWRAEGE